MEVILARADFLRRRLPPAPADAADADAGAAAAPVRMFFSSASDLMAQYFPDYADKALRLPGYWAHVEAFVLRDAAAARGVWEGVVKGLLGR
jgi:hypothetical protein